MKRTQLPQELIEDYKNNVMIVDLCKKYGLTYFIVKNGLVRMGLKKETVWGGHRKGCGRKKRERGSEIRAIREKNAKMKFIKQPEGSKFKKSSLYSAVRAGYYMGGF